MVYSALKKILVLLYQLARNTNSFLPLSVDCRPYTGPDSLPSLPLTPSDVPGYSNVGLDSVVAPAPPSYEESVTGPPTRHDVAAE